VWRGFQAMQDFEQRLATAVRDPSQPERTSYAFKGGTITLGERVDRWKDIFADHTPRVAAVKAQTTNGRFKRIATARHWLFHNTGATIDLLAVFDDMVAVLHALDGIADPAATLNVGTPAGPPGGWLWHELVTPDPQISVVLTITGQRMSIPLPRDPCLVGRDTEVAAVTAAILKRGARVRHPFLYSVARYHAVELQSC
jgi:hypothetical protein